MDDRAAAVPPRSLSPLLAAVTLAEEISRDVTARQAGLAPPRLRTALQHQSRQEAAHAALFAAAWRCVPGKAVCPPPLAAALQRYAAELHADLDRHDLAACMAGLHWVLEGLGAVALDAPAGDFARVADRVVPLRAVIQRQETAHQRLGDIWVPRLAAGPARVGAALERYLELGQAVLDAGLSELECLAADQARYRDAVAAHFESARRRLSAGQTPHPPSRKPGYSDMPPSTNKVVPTT